MIGLWLRIIQQGKAPWARVEEVGPGGATGEISQAAATGVGIQYQDKGFTVGDLSVTVNAYAGTAAIQEDGASAIKQAQGFSGCRLQAEARLAKSWIDDKSVLIQGDLQFSSGNSRGYHYILEFID